MTFLKLGEYEKYDISEDIIRKYNIKEGTISPFTRLTVIAVEEENNE